MFNAERLLGHMVKSGLRDGARQLKRMDTGSKAALGMGALGIAFAAFEHFQEQGQSQGQPTPPPTPGGAARPAAPPPLPDSADPSRGPAAVPPPLPTAAPELEVAAEQSELLIRAMIAAANADGVIDSQEEQTILQSAKDAGMDAAELEYLESEINRPRTMFEIVAGATTPELAKQVYAASCLAIRIDSEAERDYLGQLASSLHLSAAEVAAVEADLGVIR